MPTKKNQLFSCYGVVISYTCLTLLYVTMKLMALNVIFEIYFFLAVLAFLGVLFCFFFASVTKLAPITAIFIFYMQCSLMFFNDFWILTCPWVQSEFIYPFQLIIFILFFNIRVFFWGLLLAFCLWTSSSNLEFLFTF